MRRSRLALRRRIGRRFLAAPAAPPAALLLRTGLVLAQHVLALAGTHVLEPLPPFGRLLRCVCGGRTQLEEVVCGAKARMLEQPVRAMAAALQEARLQQPQLLHGRVEAP